MKSKRILALMLGAIIASGSVSQTAMQVYADLGDSSSFESISELEDSSSSESISESVPEITEAEQLKKMTDLSGSKLEDLNYRFIDMNRGRLYTSDSGLVFEHLENNEAKLVCYDGNKSDVTVPKYVSIDGTDYPVTSINKYAFYLCENLESIVIPNSVTKIGDKAFSRCTNLQSIVIPNRVTEIAGCTFRGCESLQSIVIPNRVTIIGDYAFAGCTNLKSIKIPDSVTSIDNYAFKGCTNLETIVLPKKLEEIGSYAFLCCKNLETIVIPEGYIAIGMGFFAGCTKLQSVYLPDSVTYIGGQAFCNCTNLETIVLPKDVTYIGEHAFRYCTNLESIVLPKNLKKIGNYAFAGTNISDITILASVTTLGENALEAENLKSVLVDEECKLSDSDIQKACGQYSSEDQIHRDINMDTLAYFAVGQGYRGINPF